MRMNDCNRFPTKKLPQSAGASKVKAWLAVYHFDHISFAAQFFTERSDFVEKCKHRSETIRILNCEVPRQNLSAPHMKSVQHVTDRRPRAYLLFLIHLSRKTVDERQLSVSANCVEAFGVR